MNLPKQLIFSLTKVFLTIVLATSVLTSSSVSWSNGITKNKISLSEVERDSIRYHIENLYNEMDLLIRNQTVDKYDLKKQEHDLASLRVYERIPFDQKPASLSKELKMSAEEFGISITKLVITPTTAVAPKVPQFIYTNSPFHFSDEQLVERVKVVMQVEGKEVKKWATSLPQEVLRYVKVDRADKTGKSWKIIAHAYKFRDVKFPKLKPVDPMTYLPAWARNNQNEFAQAEPVLWKFIKEIEKLKPKTPQLYEQRGQFFLNDARLSFFIKTTKRR